ncbi:MAG TPA: FtsX-like permease family protein [Burkholderiaceae bacterium]|nr:FtsX-like permease family protein [Burkholderiaceae bacterium]
MTAARLLAQSFRMTVRDWRSGEVRLLVVALAVAVAALSSVAFFVDRAQRALERDAAMFIGGDLALDSDRPIDASVPAQAGAFGLQTAQTVTFPSMAVSVLQPDRNVLAAIKAVSGAYPLRGTIKLRSLQGQAPAAGGPEAHSAWVDPQLLDSLDLAAEQTIRLGESTFRVSGVIASEPDRGVQFMSFAPRVMIRLDDLAATELVQPGSRVMYHLLVAGSPESVGRFSAWLRPQLQRGQRLQSLQEGRPDLHAALERARQFLTLVALLAAMLAAVAVATAARRFSRRRIDSCAVLRCLGLRPRDLLILFALQFAWIGCVGCLAGVLAGSLMHWLILQALAGLLPTQLPAASIVPALQAFACGAALLGGFALAPVMQLRKVPPLRVLRRDLAAWPDEPTAAVYAAASATFVALLVWLARDLRLAAVTAGGFAGASLVFAGAAWAWLAGLRSARRAAGRLPAALSFALAALARRPAATIVQVVALSFGLTALLVMATVRTDLLRQWRAQIPANAPNRFVINIQPDQVAAVQARLKELGMLDATLFPMVRGRLVAINSNPVDPGRYRAERARGLIEREFNLSYAIDPPSYNRIVQGRWFGSDSAELSIERGIADTLGIHLGDQLSFDVGGEIVKATATSVRELSWDSMKVNFFIMMSPALLRDRPQTFITSIFVPPGQADPTSRLVREFRNMTVIDTGLVLAQIRTVLDQVSSAVQFVFLFALAAGVLVLYAALSATQDERGHEAALVRAFGAVRRQLWRAQLAELSAIGSIAGLLAGLGASAIGWLLAHQVLHFEYHLSVWPFAAGTVLGAACATAGGLLALRRVIATPPWVVLREV